MIRTLMLVLVVTGWATSAPGAPNASIRISAAVDRPAMWIADRVTYTVEIACPGGLDILTDDLDRDRLKLTGLDVIGADSQRTDEGTGVRYTFTYILTTYRADVAAPAIDSFPVRYYRTRPGQRSEDAAPAGTVMVPAVAIAFRSLLPDARSGFDVRDGRPLPVGWLPYRALLPVGIGLLLVSALPVALLATAAVRRVRRPTGGRPARHAKEEARATLAELRALDVSDSRTRREAFGRLDALVRRYVEGLAGVQARSLTSGALVEAVDHRSLQIPLQSLVGLLDACELARFAPPALQPSAGVWDAALEHADRIVTGG